MIANRIRMRRPRFVLGAGLLFILGSCSSESALPTDPFEMDEPGSIAGELAVYIATFDDGTSETRYFLRDTKGENAGCISTPGPKSIPVRAFACGAARVARHSK
jgi:hypothetical protein